MPNLAEWHGKIWNLILMHKLSTITEQRLDKEYAVFQFQDTWRSSIKKINELTNIQYISKLIDFF